MRDDRHGTGLLVGMLLRRRQMTGRRYGRLYDRSVISVVIVTTAVIVVVLLRLLLMVSVLSFLGRFITNYSVTVKQT